MTDIAKELLEDVNINDHINVSYGTDNAQKFVEGILIKQSENFLTLINESGQIKILINDLRSLQIIKSPKPIPPPSPSPSPSPSPKPNDFSITREFIELKNSSQYDFDARKIIDKIKAPLKNLTNINLKKIIGGILESLKNAVKNKQVDYKYHDLRARLLKTWDICNSDEDYELFYLMLGVLAVIAKDYRYSLEPLVRSKEFLLAEYSAEVENLSFEGDIFKFCSLFSRQTNEINLETAEICIKRKDAAILIELLNENKNDDNICEKIATCAKMIFEASGAKLTTSITNNDSAYESAKKFFEMLPVEWKNQSTILNHWLEYKQYKYPKPQINEVNAKNSQLVGKIYNYTSKHWGFIYPDNFFFIKQVYDNSDRGILLRKMLYAGLWNQLEVTFRLGESPKSTYESAASHIELSEEGFEEAKRRLLEGEPSELIYDGFVETFYSSYQTGWIRSVDGDNQYKFSIDDIVDPWLKAYYQNKNELSSIYQDVTFEIFNKEKIINICWRNFSPENHETYDEYVNDEDRKQWKNFLQARQESMKKIILPENDPYRSFYYSSLPEWKSKKQFVKPSALTWSNGSITQPKNIDIPKSQQHSPSYYAELARKERLEGNFEEAEKLFYKALEIGGFDERIVSDLIYLHIKQEVKTDQALKLLNKYEKLFSAQRLLDLKIAVYEKKKDYKTLATLYEEAFKMSISISYRSQKLYSLIGAQMNIFDYEEALKTCQRWENFYQQNRNSSEIDKLKNALPSINRKKAMCYYYLGNIEEARRLATDLIRINPLDEAAIKILDGTLTADSNTTEEIDYKIDDEESNEDSMLPSFVQYMIQQSKISDRLKSVNLKGEDYIGNASEATKDVEMLALGRRDRKSFPNETVRRTSGTRSEDLFVACKLIDQLEQKFYKSPFPEGYKYKLAGRAIASWADYMVSQSVQIDTPRMAYLYAIEMLNSPEQDWYNSLNRYIRSFFMAQNALENYISQQLNSGKSEAINTEILDNGKIPDVLMREFLVGVIQLISSLEKNSKIKTDLISDLYNKNFDLRNSIVNELSNVLTKEKSSTIKEFSNQLDEAVILMKNQIKNLNSTLNETISTLLKNSSLAENKFENLNSESWNCCLTATDIKHLNKIVFIFKRVNDYLNSTNFDNRSDLLNIAISYSNDLLLSIQKEPTIAAYNTFKPILERLKLKLTDEQTNLFQNFQPQLTFEEELRPFRTPDGKIQIQLRVKNELNYQSADSLTIRNINGDQGSKIISWQGGNVLNLRGGDEDVIVFSVTLDEEEDKSGSFSANINFSFKCNDSPQDIITKDQTFNHTFVIRNETFKRLENPFTAYEGKAIKDDSPIFMGRTEETNRIINTICPNDDGVMNYGRAIAMYGQTRTGKTSLLFHLKRKIKEKYKDRVLIWDMGNLGEHPISNNTDADDYLSIFLYDMLCSGKKSILFNKIDIEKFMSTLKKILSDPLHVTLYFNDYMKELDDYLNHEKKIIILMIDEFTYLHEYIKNGKISDGFMRFWKAILQNYCIFSIIAGQDDMPEFMNEYQNEFACMEPLKITYLEEADAKRLIREPVEDRNNLIGELFQNDGCIDEIYELTAGSAYLTIILCSNLVKYLNDKGAFKVTKGIVNDFLRTRVFGANSFLTEIHFEAQLQERGHRELDDANREILLSVARQTQTTKYAKIENITCEGRNLEEIQMIVDRLVNRNVLIREQGNQYCIQVNLLKKWLLNTYGI